MSDFLVEYIFLLNVYKDLSHITCNVKCQKGILQILLTLLLFNLSKSYRVALVMFGQLHGQNKVGHCTFSICSPF